MGLLAGHAVEQVDRLPNHRAIDPREIAARRVPEVIGSARGVQVVMGWTDLDADGPAAALWPTVTKDDLENKRNACPRTSSAEVLPPGAKAAIPAERGFGGTELFGHLHHLRAGQPWTRR